MNTNTEVLARPTSALCCRQHSIHKGEAKGRIESIEGVDSYIAAPANGKDNGNVIIYFPDVNGFYNNAFLIMDAMAELSGCLVLGIDYFKGDPVWKSSTNPFEDPKFDPWKWQDDHMPFSKEVAPRWTQTVQAKYGRNGEAKFACFGYCWGAPFVCDQLSDRGICVAGGFAHPANLADSHFTGLKKPLFMSLAQNDAMFDRDRRKEAVKIMDDHGKRFHVQLFSDVNHGFALRGDMKDPYQKWVKESSLQSIMQWLCYHLAE